MHKDLVSNWIQYHAGKRKPSDPLFGAWERVDDLIAREPEEGWLVILELVEAAPDDRVLAAIAAGPLEDLLGRTPERFIDRVEIQARRDAKFRRCLTGVWGLSPVISERLAKYIATVKDPL